MNNMDIIEVLEQDGYLLKKVASTYGGEYKGPCPWCGGNDRFTAWPFRKEGKGRFICRQCNKSGDSIDYLRKKRGFNYPKCLVFLGIKAKNKTISSSKNKKWKPRKPELPSLEWQEQAKILLKRCQTYIFEGPESKRFRGYLEYRGIDESLIKKYHLGFNRTPTGLFKSRKKWGLEEEINKNTGRPKSLWIPQGFVIPMFDKSGNVIRLRIRRLKKDLKKRESKYHIIEGSFTGYMSFQYNQNNPSMIVESELDAMLCDNIIGNRINIYALGSANISPDAFTHKKLVDSKILFSLDNDGAGRNQFEWWKKHYPNIKEKYTPSGKDPGEFYQAGGDIEAWINGEIIESVTLKKPDDIKVINEPEKIIEVIKDIQDVFGLQETEDKQTIPEMPMDRTCYTGKYCNFLSLKYDSELRYYKKTCTLQEEGQDIFDDGCPKGFWILDK